MNKKQFLQNLHDVYCRLGITTHGVGVVAIRDIPAGTDVFRHADPFGSALRITKAELDSCDAPPEAKRMVQDFCVMQDGVYTVPDYGMDAITKLYYVNHSADPNLATTDGGESFVTTRPVKQGEELTVNYDTYHESDHFHKT